MPNDEVNLPGEAAASTGRSEAEQREFEIWFFEGVLEKSPTWTEVLRVMGQHYTAVGRYAEGLAIDRRLVRLSPEDPIAHYNLACSLTLVGKLDGAVEALTRAIRTGYRDLAWMQSDPDLNALREHPQYPLLVAAISR